MIEIKYVMVTSWVRHWDNLGDRWGGSTMFTIPIIKDNLATGPWPDEANTLFIKRDKGGVFEKSWIGKTKNFRKDPNNGKPAIRFEVSDLKEIDYRSSFNRYSNGWHLNKDILITEGRSLLKGDSNLQPAFFKEMETCDWETFELYSFYLLRLLGINNINKIPQTDNRGKADGFFRVNTFAVFYDATLDTDLNKKNQQIENYINQLKRDTYSVNNKHFTIKDYRKQVWIITRGAVINHLQEHDGIIVKEIPFKKLIELYNTRLTTEMDAETLMETLKSL